MVPFFTTIYRIAQKLVILLSKEKPNNYTEELENDFSNVDLALDQTPLVYDDESIAATNKSDEYFQEEFRAVFEDDRSDVEKIKFPVVRSEGFASGAFDWVRCVIIAVSIVVLCLSFVFRLVEVEGTSMNDTLENGDKVIVTNLFYAPHNNDIVVISHGTKYPEPIIKRVIAVEGQTIKLDYENDKIYVEGVELEESSYVKGTTFSGKFGDKYLPLDEDNSFVVPEGKIFVMGDNRQVSLDSRYAEIGLIDVDSVIGKAQFVVIPFSRFGGIYQ